MAFSVLKLILYNLKYSTLPLAECFERVVRKHNEFLLLHQTPKYGTQFHLISCLFLFVRVCVCVRMRVGTTAAATNEKHFIL